MSISPNIAPGVYDARWRLVGHVADDGSGFSIYRYGNPRRVAYYDDLGFIKKEGSTTQAGFTRKNVPVERYLQSGEAEVVNLIRDLREDRFTGYYFTNYDDLDNGLAVNVFYRATIVEYNPRGYTKYKADQTYLAGYSPMFEYLRNTENWAAIAGGIALLVLGL
jgi:hypothetical protein